MAATTGRWRVRLVLVLLAAVGLPVAAGVLYSFAPTEYTFYPRCLFHAMTGLHCPGCGATRCAHALLHGDFAQALAYNPLFVVLSPLLLVAALLQGYALWTGRRWTERRLPAWSLRLFVVALVAFWVLRNVPVYPFTLLAPHSL